MHHRRRKEEMKKKLQEKVAEMMGEFQDQWEPVMENLETAERAFDNLDGVPCPLNPILEI